MKASEIERKDIEVTLNIKLQPFAEMGLKANDPLIIKQLTDYFIAVLALVDRA